MIDLKRKVDELDQKLQSFIKSADLDKKKVDLKSLESESLDPDLWKDREKAKKLMQQFADLGKEIEEIESIEDEIKTLKNLVDLEEIGKDSEKEVTEIEKRLEKLTLSSFLSGPYDQKNALVSIHAGQGGVEAMDWTSMLFRLYLRYCEKRNWQTNTLDITPGEEAGIKSITFAVAGKYAYGYLKNEAGTHRLVRQSPFNADKLRQTSFALVEVLPELEEVDLPDIKVKDEDIELQFFRASSQGGQNVQKVSTAVRIVHKPTGIVVTAQSERFQEQNRKNAMTLLRAKLWALEEEKRASTKKEIKGDYHPASWGTQIRSYVLHPYKMVKDLRTGFETSNAEAVLNGDIDEFIESELKLDKA
jgi:peptide chain release factor 2